MGELSKTELGELHRHIKADIETICDAYKVVCGHRDAVEQQISSYARSCQEAQLRVEDLDGRLGLEISCTKRLRAQLAQVDGFLTVRELVAKDGDYTTALQQAVSLEMHMANDPAVSKEAQIREWERKQLENDLKAALKRWKETREQLELVQHDCDQAKNKYETLSVDTRELEAERNYLKVRLQATKDTVTDLRRLLTMRLMCDAKKDGTPILVRRVWEQKPIVVHGSETTGRWHTGYGDHYADDELMGWWEIPELPDA